MVVHIINMSLSRPSSVLIRTQNESESERPSVVLVGRQNEGGSEQPSAVLIGGQNKSRTAMECAFGNEVIDSIHKKTNIAC